MQIHIFNFFFLTSSSLIFVSIFLDAHALLLNSIRMINVLKRNKSSKCFF